MSQEEEATECGVCGGNDCSPSLCKNAAGVIAAQALEIIHDDDQADDILPNDLLGDDRIDRITQITNQYDFASFDLSASIHHLLNLTNEDEDYGDEGDEDDPQPPQDVYAFDGGFYGGRVPGTDEFMVDLQSMENGNGSISGTTAFRQGDETNPLLSQMRVAHAHANQNNQNYQSHILPEVNERVSIIESIRIIVARAMRFGANNDTIDQRVAAVVQQSAHGRSMRTNFINSIRNIFREGGESINVAMQTMIQFGAHYTTALRIFYNENDGDDVDDENGDMESDEESWADNQEELEELMDELEDEDFDDEDEGDEDGENDSEGDGGGDENEEVNTRPSCRRYRSPSPDSSAPPLRRTRRVTTGRGSYVQPPSPASSEEDMA